MTQQETHTNSTSSAPCRAHFESVDNKHQEASNKFHTVPQSVVNAVKKFCDTCQDIENQFNNAGTTITTTTTRDDTLKKNLLGRYTAAFHEFSQFLWDTVQQVGTLETGFSFIQAQKGSDSDNVKREAIASHVRSMCTKWIKGSQFAWRSLEKPRGYAGDFEMIQMLYDGAVKTQGENSTFVGQCMDVALLSTTVAESVRNRCHFVRNILSRAMDLEKSSETEEHSMTRVMSIGCGPCWELIQAIQDRGESNSRSLEMQFIGLDIDQEALDRVTLSLSKLDQTQQESCDIVLHKTNVLRLIHANATGEPYRKQDSDLLDPLEGKVDLVYSMGLTDYFADDAFIALLNWIHDYLRPNGGTAYIGNFSPSNFLRGWMDYVLDWKLVHRTEEQLLELCKRSKCGQGSCEYSVNCVDSNGIQLFLMIQKK